jgi:hypothetical protein
MGFVPGQLRRSLGQHVPYTLGFGPHPVTPSEFCQTTTGAPPVAASPYPGSDSDQPNPAPNRPRIGAFQGHVAQRTRLREGLLRIRLRNGHFVTKPLTRKALRGAPRDALGQARPALGGRLIGNRSSSGPNFASPRVGGATGRETTARPALALQRVRPALSSARHGGSDPPRSIRRAP